MSVIEQMIYSRVTSQLILSFLLTLGESDKQILNCALQDISSVEKNDLLDVFSTLECRVVPNEFNLIAILVEVSHSYKNPILLVSNSM